MRLEELARELYALTPEEFTSARNDMAKRARADGDRALAEQIRQLRKPTASAWLLNLLVRRHPGEIHELVELGGRLRDAQASLDGQRVRELDHQRRNVTQAMTVRAGRLGEEAGRPVSGQTGAEVDATLRAAMADALAADALLSGLLTRPFDATGFEAPDIEGSLALTGAAPVVRLPSESQPSPPSRPEREQRRIEETRTALAEAARSVDEARALSDRAAQRLSDARTRRGQLEASRAALQDQLLQVERDLRDASSSEQEAAADQRRTERHEARARTALARVEAALQRLEGGS